MATAEHDDDDDGLLINVRPVQCDLCGTEIRQLYLYLQVDFRDAGEHQEIEGISVIGRSLCCGDPRPMPHVEPRRIARVQDALEITRRKRRKPGTTT